MRSHMLGCIQGSAVLAGASDWQAYECTCLHVEVITTGSGSGGFMTFQPQKPGDVGHDLPCLVVRERQTWFDRLVSRISGVPVYVIWPGQVRSIHSGIRLSMPDTVWAFVDSRSSARKKGLDMAGGRIIDSGYQGELFTILRNHNWTPRVIAHWDRYAQVVFMSAVRPKLSKVSAFTKDSVRGTSGFGSTGR